jgi:hypothetical protein
MAVCILKYQLDSSRNLIDSRLWEKFYEKRWWNLFAQLLDECKVSTSSDNVYYRFELLEYVDVVKESTERSEATFSGNQPRIFLNQEKNGISRSQSIQEIELLGNYFYLLKFKPNIQLYLNLKSSRKASVRGSNHE